MVHGIVHAHVFFTEGSRCTSPQEHYERFLGSVEIPDLTSLPEIHDEPVFEGYRKRGFSPLVRDGGLVKMVIRPFSECDEGTRENNHQIIF